MKQIAYSFLAVMGVLFFWGWLVYVQFGYMTPERYSRFYLNMPEIVLRQVLYGYQRYAEESREFGVDFKLAVSRMTEHYKNLVEVITAGNRSE